MKRLVLASGTRYLEMLLLVEGPPLSNQLVNFGFFRVFLAKLVQRFRRLSSNDSISIFIRAALYPLYSFPNTIWKNAFFFVFALSVVDFEVEDTDFMPSRVQLKQPHV